MGLIMRFDARAAAVFNTALLAGAAATLASKALFQMNASGVDPDVDEPFTPRLFQTWIMFAAMALVLPAHALASTASTATLDSPDDTSSRPRTSAATAASARLVPLFRALAVPAALDVLATALMITGLLHLDASTWILLRAGGIVFVALLKHFVLVDLLKPHMWVGVFLIATAVVFVGLSALVTASFELKATASSAVVGMQRYNSAAPVPYAPHYSDHTGRDDEDAVATAAASAARSGALHGICTTVVGTLVQSLQYIWEERVLSGNLVAPPYLLIGIEGVIGTAIITFVLYPLAWMVPGDDHGSFENPLNTLAMLGSSPAIRSLSLIFAAAVIILNSSSVLVVNLLSSSWHALLDDLRPVVVWGCQLMIHYELFRGTTLGESWTLGSNLQLAGLLLLLLGTGVYNGTIQLPGVDGESLVYNSSPMSTPALTRSPLITLNRDASPASQHRRSPYAQRRVLGGGGGGAMLHGSPASALQEPLFSDSKRRPSV